MIEITCKYESKKGICGYVNFDGKKCIGYRDCVYFEDKRIKSPNADKLKVVWSRWEDDHIIHYPRKCDGSLIQSALFNGHFHSPLHVGEKELSLAEELEKRGYDLTTLKFEIKLKSQTDKK